MAPPPPPPPPPPAAPSPPATSPQADGPRQRKLSLPRIFHTELRQMMSGFGDHQIPRPESVRLLEEIVLEYITALVNRSTDVAHASRRERPDVPDIKFVIRKDTRKLRRVRYLLEMKAEIRKATNMQADEIVKGAETK